MLKESFLRKQVEKSKRDERTSPIIRALVASVVDRAALAHYQAAYPMKCLQTAAAAGALLRHLGIESRLWQGAVCFAEVFRDAPDEIGWGGFWDQDHHVWLVTEFAEYVDLSISRLHEHPASRRTDGLPVPAVWWPAIDGWPHTIRYLLEAPIAIGIPPDEQRDLELFVEKARQELAETIESRDAGNLQAPAMLHGPASLNELYVRGHPWVVNALRYQDLRIPHPDWIRARQQQIAERQQRG